jgi:PEGA domain
VVYLDDPPPHRKPPWGRAPHGALIETGPHKLWVEAPGYEPASKELTVEHGQALEIAPEMTRVGYGYLVVDGNAEEVTVKVDGVRRGIYTAVGDPLHLRLDAGKHRIELEAGGRKTYAGDVEVPRGQRLGVHGLLSYKPERGSAVVTGALTVGAIVGGVALFKQQPAPSPSTPTGTTPTSVAPWFKVGGAVSLGLAALLGFSTVYVLVTDSKPPSRVRLDKVKDLDEDELDTPPAGATPGPRERLFGSMRPPEPRVVECRGP